MYLMACVSSRQYFYCSVHNWSKHAECNHAADDFSNVEQPLEIYSGAYLRPEHPQQHSDTKNKKRRKKFHLLSAIAKLLNDSNVCVCFVGAFGRVCFAWSVTVFGGPLVGRHYENKPDGKLSQDGIVAV